ncbi:MAG: acyl carrier protein [Dehalococcoidia bacterium]|nr:MAG: acyl carrier protein [Dehalococcoidia bacterium]
MATVYERVKKVTIAQLGVTEDEVSPDSALMADLGADSLDLVELMMALEQEFSTSDKKITIPDEESEKMMSVQDAVDFLHGIGISDVQAQPKPVEKSGFARINLPRPNISRPNQPRQDRPQDKQMNRQGGGNPPRGGQQQQQRRDNRPRRDRPQGNMPRPNNPPRQQQQPPPAPQPPPQAPQKPPEPGNPAS